MHDRLQTAIMNVRLQSPFTMLVVGASGSGKSVFTRKLLYHAGIVLNNAPKRIVWCYGAAPGDLDDSDYTAIEYHQGLPGPKIY